MKALKPITFAICLVPLAKIGVDALRGALTANPIEAVMNRLGFWTLVMLVAALAVTPLKIFAGWTWPVRIRRMVGVFAFFYAALHFSTYLVLDQFFDWSQILEDLLKRKFIYVGFAAFVLLIPLAVTSTNGWVKRLGFKRWKLLHRLTYLAAVLAIIHFVWRVKADLLVPSIFGGVLGLLFAIRIVEALKARAAQARRVVARIESGTH